MRGSLKSSSLPLQMAIFQKLNNDPILKTMITGVYDEVKEGAILPYICFGEDTINSYDTKTDYGENTTLTMHVWSAGPGKTEAKRIADAMLQSLTASPITLNEFNVEGLEREFIQFLQDGQVYHGICRFRVYTKQI